MASIVMDEPTVQAHLVAQQDMTASRLCSFVGGTAAVFTTRSPDKETVNEDAAALIPFRDDSGVLVVADGLGGHTAGEAASRLAIEKLCASLVQGGANGQELRDAILNGIEDANQAVIDLASDSATTLAVVEIQGPWIRPYHVGDSVILLVGNRGKIKLQTISHSPIGYAVESGMLDEQEAMHHEHRHLISNIIGSTEMRIEIGAAIQMAPRDTLLLASDGLADNLHVDEIVQLIRRGPIDRVAESVSTETLRRMQKPTEGRPSKPDDLTFITFRRSGGKQT